MAASPIDAGSQNRTGALLVANEARREQINETKSAAHLRFLASILIIVVSVGWLDKPIAYFVYEASGQYLIVGNLTGTPSFFSPLAILVFLVFVARRGVLRPFGRLDAALILADLGIILAMLVVPALKLVFGRTWPQYHMPSIYRRQICGGDFGSVYLLVLVCMASSGGVAIALLPSTRVRRRPHGRNSRKSSAATDTNR
jgi:hypothetical protein